ncbi:hypothetical protein Prum_038700 [Phytohabitans rumicis]|uniref:Response regulatory domain-containing protein n=1 Tax=Phytohabitans rumicis TaxID=1076125 RepID=A0A6V8L5E7_9ACTN|nr:hypothetical protein Prum_038700 [Phytohabitans rumicis]
MLVADEDAAKRQRLVDRLKAAGHRTIEARTGAEALALVDAEPVDLVVLNVKLPDVTGFEVCERIKSTERHAALPVIYVSALAVQMIDRTRGLSGGADAYLTEPFEADELIASVHSLLRYYHARRHAEQLAQRMTRLAETTLALSLAPSVAKLLEAASAGAARIFEGPAVVFAETVDGAGMAAATNGPDSPTAIHVMNVDDPGAPVGIAVRVDAPGGWPLAAWPAGDTVSVAIARLRVDRAPVYVAVATGTQMSGYPMLRQLAQAVAAAVEAQRSYDEEHRIAVTLQRSLLPPRVPQIAGLDIAVRYEPASAETEIGGDFYELTMIEGDLLVAIGDVTGHSLHAATVMAELRHAVRAYAVEGHPPGAVLHRVDVMMRTLLPGELATLCLLLLDPGTGRIRMASAGHLPPLVVTRDRKVRYHEHLATLLGVRAHRPDDIEFTLPKGGTLVLFTDGLIERRGSDIDEGLSTLANAASRVDADIERFCDRLLAELSGPEVDDDIALVAIRRA